MRTVTSDHSPAPSDPFGLVRACRELHAAVDAFDALAADSVGIARNDLRCLNLLEGGPLPAKSIATALGLTTGSVTALLDRLERKDLVERKPHPTDRRGLLIQATPKVFRDLAPVYRRMGEEVVALATRYEKREAEDAVKHLTDIAEAFQRAADKTR